jgi:hypothetical protein
MAKKTEKADAIVDIIIIAALVFTVMVVVPDPIMKYVLTIAGCGAMYNNVKYVIKSNKKKKDKKKKDKKKKEEEK